jgi:hypothetical protein
MPINIACGLPSLRLYMDKFVISIITTFNCKFALRDFHSLLFAGNSLVCIILINIGNFSAACGCVVRKLTNFMPVQFSCVFITASNLSESFCVYVTQSLRTRMLIQCSVLLFLKFWF